jgi:hypothetical protein
MELITAHEVAAPPAAAQPTIVWLRQEVAALEATIAEWDTAADRYRAEQQIAQSLIDGAKLGDDENALARALVRVNLLTKELARIRNDRAPAAQKLDVLRSRLADEEGKIEQARAIVALLHTGGLTHAKFYNRTVGDIQREYYRALATLNRAGEAVKAQPIELAPPRWHQTEEVQANV